MHGGRMDDYLSKPVRFEDLSAVVKRIQADCGEQGPAIGAESLEALRELGIDDFGGNSDILTDLIDTFLENAAQIFAQATDALSRREPAALALAAHTLKEAARTSARLRSSACARSWKAWPETRISRGPLPPNPGRTTVESRPARV